MRRSRLKHNDSGVTLIELMIAITLVAILAGGLLTAMRAGLITYEKTGQRLNANRRGMNVQQIIANQLENAVPAAGLCQTSDEKNPVTSIPFFAGGPNWLRMVTTYSIAEGARGAARIVEYQAQPLAAGGFRLAVAEHPYLNASSTMAYCGDLQERPVELGPAPVVLMDLLGQCRFEYHLAYNSFTYEELPWVDVWDTRYPSLPAAVHIEMRAGAPTTLPVVSFTIPLRADRNPVAAYADSY